MAAENKETFMHFAYLEKRRLHMHHIVACSNGNISKDLNYIQYLQSASFSKYIKMKAQINLRIVNYLHEQYIFWRKWFLPSSASHSTKQQSSAVARRSSGACVAFCFAFTATTVNDQKLESTCQISEWEADRRMQMRNYIHYLHHYT